MPDRNARVWTGSEWESISSPVSSPNAIASYQSTAPSSPVTGQIWIDSDDGTIYVWSGSAWQNTAALPSQVGQSGRYLTTNGITASWGVIDISSKADLSSPIFTGTPTAPTAAVLTNTTQIATTAFVNAEIANDAVLNTGGSTITVSSGTTVPLTIQNNGTGNSFVVNDVASDTTPFVIDASGNVSVGGTSITLRDSASNGFVQVNSGNTTNTGFISFWNASSTRMGYVGYASNGSNGGMNLWTDTGNALSLGTNNAERMVIDSVGRIRIPAGGILEAPISTNAQTASYTLVLTDAGRLIEMNVGSANTVTIPLDSSVNFPIGTKIDIVQTGTGATQISPTSGVTLNSDGNKRTLNAQWAAASLVKRAANTWILIGNIKA